MVTFWYVILTFTARCCYLFTLQCLLPSQCSWSLLWHILAVTKEISDGNIIIDGTKNHFHWVTYGPICPGATDAFLLFVLEHFRSLRLYNMCGWMITGRRIWKDVKGSRVGLFVILSRNLLGLTYKNHQKIIKKLWPGQFLSGACCLGLRLHQLWNKRFYAQEFYTYYLYSLCYIIVDFGWVPKLGEIILQITLCGWFWKQQIFVPCTFLFLR